MTIETPSETLSPSPVNSETSATSATPEVTASPPAASAWPDWAPPTPELGPDERLPRDPRSLTFEELTAAVDCPAERPGDYQVPALTGDPSPEILQEVQAAQSLLWHANFPKQAGDTFLNVLVEEARRAGPEMDDAGYELLVRQTEKTLIGILGEPEYARQHDAFMRMMDDLNAKTGGRLDEAWGDVAHVLMQPRVFQLLLAHAGRLEHRRR